MVDLMGQYKKIKKEVDLKILESIESGKLINGPIVKQFSENLKEYLKVKYVIPCGNGTDALQIAFMAAGLKPGDEIICPAWTYVATAEAAALLGIIPVMCDVDVDTFNITAENVEPLINSKTKAIVPVHLYGQSCDMDPLIELAKNYNLKIIEDNAQAIGCKYSSSSMGEIFTGTIGDIGITSFYPSKNLGAYGDGGALFTNDAELAERILKIANHGQNKKYHHEIIGCNSRLDSIQAEILNIKLRFLDDYNSKRIQMASAYNDAFNELNKIKTPVVIDKSSHVYHQYTITVLSENQRDSLKSYLSENNIPSMIYYPIPLYRQKAFKNYVKSNFFLKNTEYLAKNVLSLPIHTEIETSNQEMIIEKVLNFFK